MDLSQEDNGASEITCASMRVDELRDGLVREISRAMDIGLRAQPALPMATMTSRSIICAGIGASYGRKSRQNSGI